MLFRSETELLLSLRTENAKNVSAAVGKKVLPTVNVTVTFRSLIATSAGIPLVIAFITVMIYICLWTHKVIYLYFLIIPVLPNMIPTAFCTLFSE